MAFNISEFTTNVLSKQGLLKPSLYIVNIKNHKNARDYSFLTEAVAIPTVGMDTQAIRRHGYGPVEYVPFRPVFQDSIRMNLITQSSKANILSDFLIEISNISPFMNYNGMSASSGGLFVGGGTHPYEVQYKKEIEFDIDVMIYNENQKDIMTYTFKNCYAKQVGGIDLGWGNTDQYVRTSVDFAFTDFGIDSAPKILTSFNVNPATKIYLDGINAQIEASAAASAALTPERIAQINNTIPDYSKIGTEITGPAPTETPPNHYVNENDGGG
jgi:hypothetical protein